MPTSSRLQSIALNLFASAALLLYGAHAAAVDSAAADDQVLEEVIVTATLRQQSLVATPVSITVLDERTLRDAGRQHFEDVLAAVPNLNWAGGTSRPRFFQIRGIGEREQYEGAPNPSVGFLIDDIDFSGIGMPATLFDVESHRGAARAAGNALRRQRARGSDRDARPRACRRVRVSRPKLRTANTRANPSARSRPGRSKRWILRGASPCSVTAATAIAATYSCAATTPTIVTS